MNGLFGASLLALAVTGSTAGALPAPALFKAVSPSIVSVHAYGASGEGLQGSGIVVEPGQVATNCHVVDDATSVSVLWSGREYPATIEYADQERDLCQLAVPQLRAPAATVGSSDALNVGDSLFAVGAPRGLELTLSEGILSGRRDGLLQTSAPISPGSSGGGLFDDHGRLVGVTTSYLRDSQQLNFAAPVEWIAEIPARSRNLAAAIADAADSQARAALQAWDARMFEVDPSYAARRSTLDAEVRAIRETLQPAQWVQATERAYSAMTKRAPTPGLTYRCSASGQDFVSDYYLPASGCVGVSTQPGTNRWVSIPSKNHSREVSVDLATLAKAGDVANAWVKVHEQTLDTLLFLSIICSERRYSIPEGWVTNENGAASLPSVQPELVRIGPDSVAEAVWGYACLAPSH